MAKNSNPDYVLGFVLLLVSVLGIAWMGFLAWLAYALLTHFNLV